MSDADIRRAEEDLHFWVPSDAPGRESLDFLLAEVRRLRLREAGLVEKLHEAHGLLADCRRGVSRWYDHDGSRR